MTIYYGKFNDSVLFDVKKRQAVSLRDGILIYLGGELGLQPIDKEFRVFRSPATIANAGLKMPGIPLTDQHVDVDIEVMSAKGNVQSSEIIDFNDPDNDAKLAVKNVLEISDQFQNENRELSLGYTAELITSDNPNYDFEQKNILPHHLAVVERGRCGPNCAFLDSKPINKETEKMPVKLHKVFSDENGDMNLSKIVEIMTALPEAMKQVPLEKVMEVLPALEEILNVARGVNASPDEQVSEETSEETSEVVEDEETEEVMDENPDDEEEKKKFGDALIKAKDEAVKLHTQVVVKALSFIDNDHSLIKDKTTLEIQRIAVEKSHPNTKFTDEQIPVAFEMLQHQPTEIKPTETKKGSFAELRSVTV